MTGSGSVCTKGTQSYMGKPFGVRSFCVNFYSDGTNEYGKSMIYQIIHSQLTILKITEILSL